MGDKAFGAVFGVIFALAGAGIMFVGGGLAIHQQRVIQNYRPMAAVVLSEHITREGGHSHNGATYRPDILYRYRVGGEEFTSQNVTMISGESSSYSWAAEYLHRYPVGTHCTAYYNPADPVYAVLDRTASFLPYALALFGLPFLAVGLGVMRSVFGRPALNLQPQSESAGWYRLTPSATLGARERFWLLVAVASDVFMAAVFGHFYRLAAPPYDVFPEILSAVCAVLAVAPLVIAWRLFRVGGMVRDGAIEISAPALTIGGAVWCRIRQTYRRTMQIRSVKVTLICTRITRRGGSITEDWPWRNEYDVAGDAQVSAEQEMTWTAPITAPVDWPPSTPSSLQDFVNFRYTLRLHVEMAGAPSYRESFIVQLVAGEGAGAGGKEPVLTGRGALGDPTFRGAFDRQEG